MDSWQLESMREEALKFVDEVKETFRRTLDSGDKWGQFMAALQLFHAKTTNNETLVKTLTNLFQGHDNLLAGYQKFVPRAGFRQPVKNGRVEKGTEFIKRVKAISPDISSKVMSVLKDRKELGKTQSYNKICALLNGHADLFHLYESLLMDGSEESRREIESLRLQAKESVMGEVGLKLEEYGSTIKVIEEGSGESLSALHLRCTAEMYTRDNDGEMRRKRMNDLAVRWKKDPEKVEKGVVPRLRWKVMQIQQTYDHMSKYFDQLLSHPAL